MRFPKIFICIAILCALILYSCSDLKEDSHLTNSSLASSNTSNIFFVKANQESDIKKKLQLLGKGLDAISHRNDTLLPILLNHKTFNHQQLGEYDSSLYFADSLVSVSRFQKDTSFLAQAFYRKSIVYRFQGNQIEEFRNAFNSYNLYKKINDSLNTAKRALEMSIVQSDLTDFEGSQVSATEVLKYLSTIKDSVTISGAYNVIAIAYNHQGIYTDAIKEYKNALRFSTLKIDSISYYNNMAIVYREQGKYDKAIALFNYCLNAVDTNSVGSRARYMENLAMAQWSQNPSINIEPELLTALNLKINAGLNRTLFTSYGHLLDIYENHNKPQALEYAVKYLEGSIIYDSKSSELKALEKLTMLSPAGQSKIYAKKFISLNDSLNKLSLRAKNTFAKIKFDEERKQKEILGLETQNTMQARETRQLRTRSWIGVLVGTLVILGLFFLIYYFRQRQKKHEIQEVHKTESRISKVIHDELANDIFNIMSSLEPVAPVPVIDKLEKIYLRTRDISRENREIDTGEDYVDYLKAILSNNTPDDSKLIVSGENSVNWDKLKEEQKIVIYRVLQELMINMKKHSGAKLVAISFVVKNKTLSIRYSDNGCGILWNPSKKGSGLQNAENRISSLNGKITFESEKEKGFKIDMQIPV